MRRSPVAVPEELAGDDGGDVCVEAWDGVGVGVDRDGDRRVAEAVRHDLGVHTGGEGEGGPRVAKVVRTSEHRETAPAHQRLEAAGHGVGVEGLALGFAEDERRRADTRSEEHTSELQSLMRNSYAVF